MPKVGPYTRWHPPVVNDLFCVCYDVHSDCIFQVLVISAIIFRLFLINVYTLCTLVFIILRSEVPSTMATGPLA